MLTKISQHNRRWRHHLEPSIWAELAALQKTGAGFMGKHLHEIYLGLLLREGDCQQIRSSPDPVFLHSQLLFTGSSKWITAVTRTEFLSYTLSIVQPSGKSYRVFLHYEFLFVFYFFFFFLSVIYLVFWDRILRDPVKLALKFLDYRCAQHLGVTFAAPNL